MSRCKTLGIRVLNSVMKVAQSLTGIQDVKDSATAKVNNSNWPVALSSPTFVGNDNEKLCH
jgi:hypothetical protein